MDLWEAKLVCRLLDHEELDIKPTFRNPKKGDSITRTWDCPRCGETTFKTYIWQSQERSD